MWLIFLFSIQLDMSCSQGEFALGLVLSLFFFLFHTLTVPVAPGSM